MNASGRMLHERRATLLDYQLSELNSFTCISKSKRCDRTENGSRSSESVAACEKALADVCSL